MKRWTPFALLCGVASCVWMVTDAWPGVRFGLGTSAVGCVVAAVVVSGFVARRPVRRGVLMAALGGAMVLVGPSVGSFVGASVEAVSLALALTLTAVVVSVVESAGSGASLEGERLWPGLVACAGLLVALSPPSLGDWRTDMALVLAPVVTGAGAVVFGRSEAEGAWKIVAGLAGAGVVFGMGAAVRGGWEISWAGIGVEALLVGLALVALVGVTAGQYAARYAVAPLLTLVQGVVLLHSMVTWRVGVCAGMLVVAAIAMLRRSEEESL